MIVCISGFRISIQQETMVSATLYTLSYKLRTQVSLLFCQALQSPSKIFKLMSKLNIRMMVYFGCYVCYLVDKINCLSKVFKMKVFHNRGASKLPALQLFETLLNFFFRQEFFIALPIIFARHFVSRYFELILVLFRYIPSMPLRCSVFLLLIQIQRSTFSLCFLWLIFQRGLFLHQVPSSNVF